jgi:heterodisulfide reductase subunit C
VVYTKQILEAVMRNGGKVRPVPSELEKTVAEILTKMKQSNNKKPQLASVL